jgi:hypothetical protein
MCPVERGRWFGLNSKYVPPAGKAGAFFAKILGEDANSEILPPDLMSGPPFDRNSGDSPPFFLQNWKIER